jgi:hypothetical protein
MGQARSHGVELLLTGGRGDELTGDWAFDELGLLLSGQVAPGPSRIWRRLRLARAGGGRRRRRGSAERFPGPPAPLDAPSRPTAPCRHRPRGLRGCPTDSPHEWDSGT